MGLESDAWQLKRKVQLAPEHTDSTEFMEMATDHSSTLQPEGKQSAQTALAHPGKAAAAHSCPHVASEFWRTKTRGCIQWLEVPDGTGACLQNEEQVPTGPLALGSPLLSILLVLPVCPFCKAGTCHATHVQDKGALVEGGRGLLKSF